MPSAPKKPAPHTAKQRTAARRDCGPFSSGAGCARDPKGVVDLKRQAKLMAQHPQDAEINDWIEAAYD